MVFLAVVESGVVFLLAPLVVGFDAVHRLGGQTLLQQRVVGKHFFAVHEDAHGFVHPIEFPVLLRHARQLLDEFVETRPLTQIEGGGVEHHRVAPHDEAACLGGRHSGAQQHLRRFQGDVAEVERVGTLHGGKTDLARMIAHAGGFEAAVVARHVAGEASQTVATQLMEPHCAFVNGEYADFHVAQHFTRLGIDEAPRHDVGGSTEAAEQQKKAEENASHEISFLYNIIYIMGDSPE